jgi:hypothetical protein
LELLVSIGLGEILLEVCHIWRSARNKRFSAAYEGGVPAPYKFMAFRQESAQASAWVAGIAFEALPFPNRSYFNQV